MKKNILGIETATFDNYIYKEVGYTIKGQPVSVLHTTKKEDDKILKFKAIRDCSTVQYLPRNSNIMDINKSFEKVFKSYKKGDTISI